MAANPVASSSALAFLQFSVHSPSLFPGNCSFRPARADGGALFAMISSRSSRAIDFVVRSREEESASEILTDDGDFEGARGSRRVVSDSLSLGIRESVYEVVEVSSNGMISTQKINRRDLLKSSGLRPRDVRSVDPSLWLTNTMPSLVVRDNAILLNLGSLRAIVMQESVFIFNYNRKGGKAFIDELLPRLSSNNMNGGPSMPFELELLRSRTWEFRLLKLPYIHESNALSIV